MTKLTESTSPNLFMSLSSRKDKYKYKLYKLYARKYFESFKELLNGIIIPNYQREGLFDLIDELKQGDIKYSLSTEAIKNKKIEFVFFYQVSKTGYAILKRDKDYIKKYIIYPTLNEFKGIVFHDYYIHLPETPSGATQLSFSFDVDVAYYNLNDQKLGEFKAYIERRIEKRLIGKKLIMI